jgi:hypothetical protein
MQPCRSAEAHVFDCLFAEVNVHRGIGKHLQRRQAIAFFFVVSHRFILKFK